MLVTCRVFAYDIRVMKHAALVSALAVLALLAACDVQSGMTKKSLEKYNPSPTPVINVPTPEPINPGDVVTVDPEASGPTISVNKPAEAKRVKCTKYNRVAINADGLEVNIDGVCKQIMINGDGNKITVTAVSEVVANGTDNKVEFYKYANGKQPFVADNTSSNTVAKGIPPEPAGKTVK